ncbi:MAG TPA: peptide chain release factor-like protein [bacterium]|jgi:protein subunit release factor B|nr:peptide chain release factor-like protein [Myxococcales bacterium]OQA61955.1 MAG: Peptide chain release factor 2 [bacterium ADurb.Bin270]HPW44891.1 peptide chain release factor-like protein [bacterium]HQC50900.1 peptide chain release factor-like protein [bacterium]HQG13849.1 peptide chain release factor-like protein [bacterium]
MTVSKEKWDLLYSRMKAAGISEGDIEEKFVRSSGKGGQNVNKLSTCVVLKHLPSGIIIKCQDERSQGMNRFFARRRLLERLERARLGCESEAEKKRWKIKKQKKKRSKKAKEKILREKRRISEKKSLRKRPVEG